MKMETKRSPFLKIAGGMLAVSLLTTCVISGTMAKYTSSASGSDTARAAKWSILVNGTEIATRTPQTMDFDLFNTIGDDDNGYDDDVNVVNVSEDEPAIIAPGTGGKIDLVITNNSEVTAEYDLELSENNPSGIPIQYSFDGAYYFYSFADLKAMAENTYDGWADMIMQIAGVDLTNAAPNSTITIPVDWAWAFDENSYVAPMAGQTDETDTNLGIGAGDEIVPITITAKVTANQVD